MKFSTSLSAGIGALALLAGSLFTAQPATAATVEIADSGLKGCINRALGQADQADVSAAQAAGLAELNCDNRVESLIGLENFTSLTSFTAIGNRATLNDLTPLSGITTLTKLSIGGSAISDLSPLKQLSGLTELSLRIGNIGDASVLSSLVNLKTLDLTRNRIFDLRPFKPLVDRGASVRVLFQYYPRLAPAKVGESWPNPARDLDGAFPSFDVDRGSAIVTEDFSNWTWTKAAEANVVEWRSSETRPERLEASGAFVQDSLPTATTIKDDSASTDYQSPATIDVLANDGLSTEAPLDRATLTLLDGQGTPVKSLALAAGTFDIVDGKIRFSPATGFSGTVPAVRYQVANVDGITSTAKLTITVGAAPAIVLPPAIPEPARPANNVTPAGNPANAAVREELANTGATTSAPLALAGLLLLAGIAAVLFSRRRAS
ncbi:MAG: LPXTG cell wall anchor domain-containing protein [Renibacterium sp.]|nr:LPXTG cell wall anchor domain-containing protein [Renibacterium sp.]